MVGDERKTEKVIVEIPSKKSFHGYTRVLSKILRHPEVANDAGVRQILHALLINLRRGEQMTVRMDDKTRIEIEEMLKTVREIGRKAAYESAIQQDKGLKNTLRVRGGVI